MLCYAMWQALPHEGSVDLAITRQALEPACFYIQTTSTAALGFKTTRLTKAAHNGQRRGKAGTTDVGSLRPTCTCQRGERSTAGPVLSVLAPSEPVPCIASATGIRMAGATTKSCM